MRRRATTALGPAVTLLLGSLLFVLCLALPGLAREADGANAPEEQGRTTSGEPVGWEAREATAKGGCATATLDGITAEAGACRDRKRPNRDDRPADTPASGSTVAESNSPGSIAPVAATADDVLREQYDPADPDPRREEDPEETGRSEDREQADERTVEDGPGAGSVDPAGEDERETSRPQGAETAAVEESDRVEEPECEDDPQAYLGEPAGILPVVEDQYDTQDPSSAPTADEEGGERVADKPDAAQPEEPDAEEAARSGAPPAGAQNVADDGAILSAAPAAPASATTEAAPEVLDSLPVVTSDEGGEVPVLPDTGGQDPLSLLKAPPFVGAFFLCAVCGFALGRRGQAARGAGRWHEIGR